MELVGYEDVETRSLTSFSLWVVHKRIKQLSTGSAKKIFCLGYFQGTMEDESKLHSRFGKLRLRSGGEWFASE